jgi:hypothetical protein
MLKLGVLDGTDYERTPVEIFINLVRALIIIPIAAWTLLNQWATSGTGKKTDDVRTTMVGKVSPLSPDSFADYVEPHKGDRNLLIRSVFESLQLFLTFWLICFRIDTFHNSVQGFCEISTAVALLVQWRADHASTHYVRAFVSFLTVPSFVHLGICGYGWPWDGCDADAWSDMRRPYRNLMLLAAVRMLANGISLVCQNAYPARGVTATYGNEQLFFRSLIRASGIPLYASITLQAFTEFNGTKWQRPAIEIVINLIRACLILPILTMSLIHQWRYTGIESHPRCTPRGSMEIQDEDEMSKLAETSKLADAAQPATADKTPTKQVPTQLGAGSMAISPSIAAITEATISPTKIAYTKSNNSKPLNSGNSCQTMISDTE